MDDNLDIDKTISSAHLNAGGWALQEYAEGTPIDSHMIYVKDCRTGKLWVFGVPPDSLKQALRDPSPFSMEELVGGISEAFLQISRQGKDGRPMNGLSMLLCHYLSRTQTYSRWRQQSAPDARMQALLLIYGTGGDAVNLRPAIMQPQPGVVSSEMVEAICDQVVAMDRANRPEWFR